MLRRLKGAFSRLATPLPAPVARDARRLSFLLLFAPFLLWIGLMIVLPHIEMFSLSLREKISPGVYEVGVGNYLEFAQEPAYRNTLLRTAVMSVAATFFTLLIGFPVAYYIAKIARRRMKTALFLLCLAPLWVSDLVRAFGWILLLRETGVVSSFLVWSGLSARPIEFLYNDATVMMGVGLYGDAFYDCAARGDAGRNGRRHDRSRLQPGRRRLDGVAQNHLSLRDARHRLRLHRGFYADRGQLSDAGDFGRQKQHLVHRANLQSIHRPLQLGIGGGVRLFAFVFHFAHGVGEFALERADAGRGDCAPMMIRSLPQGRLAKPLYDGYIAVFLIFLLAPLAAAGAFAFNDSLFPSMPWRGFTLDWFVGDSEPKLGLFYDRKLLKSLAISALVGMLVAALCLATGLSNAFLFERCEFRGKAFCYMLMILPLVIPGVILGISILVFRAASPTDSKIAASSWIFCAPACRWWSWGNFRSSPQSPLWSFRRGCANSISRSKRRRSIWAPGGRAFFGRSFCRDCDPLWSAPASSPFWSLSKISTRLWCWSAPIRL